MKEILGGRGGHACGFLFNFSKVTENATIFFFHIFCDVAIGPGARFSKLPVITGPVKLFCFPFQTGVSEGLKIVQ